MSDGIKELKELAQLIRYARVSGENTAERVGRTFEGIVDMLSDVTLDKLRAIFLNKDREDQTAFLLSFLSGAVFGKDGFASGLTGFGAKIDKDGYGEMRGLRLWEWLEVPELRYNRVEAVAGIKWRSPGMGIIESCQPDRSPEGELLSTGTVQLKLEDGELGMVVLDDIALGIYHFGDERDAMLDKDDSKGNFAVKGFATTYFRITGVSGKDLDDIALGIYHFGDERDAMLDKDDSKGNFAVKGFATTYFRITGVSGKDNNTFTYSLRPGYTVHPQPQMHFVCYGNFTDESRQSSVYETRAYTRMLWKQNTWEIGKKNIALQQGDLTNLSIHGMNMQGRQSSVYETRAYTRMLWKQNTWEIGKKNIALQQGDLTNLSIHGMNMQGYSMYINSVYFTGTVTQVKPTWEIGKKNIALQQGDLTNLSIHGMNMQGYSMYINSVYFTGTVTQVKPDGTPVRVANDRGAWQAGKYDYYDRVSHNGCLWLCVNEKGTDSEPTEGNADWLKQVDKGADGTEGSSPVMLAITSSKGLWLCVNEKGTDSEPTEGNADWLKQVDKGADGTEGSSPVMLAITSSKGVLFQGGVQETLLTATAYRDNLDITAKIPPSRFSWTRTSTNTEDDKLWNSTHRNVGRSITIDADDVNKSAVFSCDVELSGLDL